MSYTQYDQYGGNPYSNASHMESGRGNHLGEPPLDHEMSNLSAASNYSNSGAAAPAMGSTPPKSEDPFLEEVTRISGMISDFSGHVSRIRALHGQATRSTDASPPAGLEALTADTQRLTSSIRNSIKYLEANLGRSTAAAKRDQLPLLKRKFKIALDEYVVEEQGYRKACVEEFGRQYKIVYPNASDDDVQEAAKQDWGNQGVFQTALRDSTRSRQGNAAAGAVLTRHNDLAQIEKTLSELAAMFAEMAQIVETQEPAVQRGEDNAAQTAEHVQKGNVQIDKANEHARRRNRLKWWCLLVVVLIILAVALGVGLGVGLAAKTTKTATS